ncbi:MAG: hypothetical protein AB7T06_14465 [Kofleriaceae bacterium]
MLVHLVNYFGHAAVASWSNRRGGFPLGAMLPDFSTMIGVRVNGTPDADVAEGIALHHTTDKVFHSLPAVTALMRDLDARLERGGCARGPRRAVAHIGVELLLDGVLVKDPEYREAYMLGVEYDASIDWREDGHRVVFEGFMRRMRARGVPDDLDQPEAVAFRLGTMLSRRPLLAPSPSDNAVIVVALVEHKPRIEIAARTVMRALRAALT